MYRWCSHCHSKQQLHNLACPQCRRTTHLELDINDTLRIDDRREFVITQHLSRDTDAGMSTVYMAARKDKPNMRGAIKVAKPERVESLKREAI